MFITGLLALATADTLLMPSGKWTVDYEPTMCIASRQFGPAATPTYLAFQPSISMETSAVKLFILTPNEEGPGAKSGMATLKLQPSGESRSMSYFSLLPKQDGPRAYEIEIEADFMDKVGASTGLTLEAGKAAVEFTSGKIQPVLDAMTTCNNALMRQWGADPSAKAIAIGNPGSWFTDDDYPTGAMHRRAQGRTVIVITVSPDGKTKACRVAVSSGDAELDRGTCDIATRRGQYAPKAGGDRFAVYSVRWMLDG